MKLIPPTGIIEKSSNTLISSCVGTKIPSSVTSIGDNAFYGCYGLTNVAIPNPVTSIGNNAFYGCYGLTSVAIPNSVTSIGDNAFYGCYGLTSVAIPNSVTSIGDNAFYGCSGLTRVDITDLAAWSMIEYVKPYGSMSPSSNPLSWA